MVKYRKRTYRKGNRKVAKTVKKYIRKAIDNMVEDKVIYTNVAAPFGVSDVSSYALLNGCAQGAAKTQRLGQKIKLKSVQLRISFAINAASLAGATSGNFFRILLLYDRQTNAGNPSNAQLFVSTTATETYESPLNIVAVQRYKILHDKVYVMNPTGGATNISPVKFINIRKKLRNLPTVFNTGVAGDVTDINTGSLILVLLCDANIVASYHNELRFEDA